MKHCSPFCAGIWPFLLFPLLLLIPLLYFMWHGIEHDVANNVSDALSTDHSWAKVETFNNGRDALLTGTAPENSSIAEAEQIARNVKGVRSAKFIGDVASSSPPSLELRNASGKLILLGTLSSQASVDALFNAAVSKHGSKFVRNELKVGSNTAKLASANSLLLATDWLPDGASLSVEGDELILRGSVEAQSTKSTLEQQLAAVFAGNIRNLLIIKPLPKVENNICQDLLNQLLATTKINFESGNASIKEESKRLIQNIANTAKRCPEAQFEVAGHTDSTGTTEFNMQLSERRALAVVEAVMQLGLSGERFTTRGFGASDSIADNTTAEGRAENRRIEFTIKN